LADQPFEGHQEDKIVGMLLKNHIGR